MKSLKFLAAAAFFAGALIQQAAATTPHIYITGSSAFRSAAINAITTAVHLTGSPSLVAGGGTGNDTTYTNANPPAGQSTTGTQNTSFIWQGGWIGSVGSSTFVTVCATFTGSQTGVCTTMSSRAIPFLPDTAANTTTNPSCYLDAQGAFPNITSNTYVGSVSHTVVTGNYAPAIQFVPDMTFSDVFQSTTPFNGSLHLGTPFNANVTFVDSTNGGNDNQVGFVTFKWLASKNFPLGMGSTNVNEGTVFGSGYTVSSISIEPNQISNLFSAGNIPLSQLTGSVNSTGGTNNDQTTIIFATGRNPDSGTRGTALADSGYGVLNAVNQYQPTFINGGVVTTHAKYPIETIAGLSTGSVGNSGEATGGSLRAYLADTLATNLSGAAAGTTAAYYITYLGTADAANGAVIGKAVELSYKGVPFSLNAIYQGAYTFWAIEHLMDRGDLVSPQSDTEAAIISALNATPTSGLSKAGISNLDVTNNLFQASRTSDGGQISVNFTP